MAVLVAVLGAVREEEAVMVAEAAAVSVAAAVLGAVREAEAVMVAEAAAVLMGEALMAAKVVIRGHQAMCHRHRDFQGAS